MRISKEDIKTIDKEIDNSLKDVNDCFDGQAYEHSLEKSGPLNDEQIKEVRRLEFTSKTKRILAERVGYRCSCPDCNAVTIGPGENPGSVTLLGEAAHIIGAIINDDGRLSPRCDPTKTPKEIKNIDNGIWLCCNHHKLVDSRTSEYNIKTLKDWKNKAEQKQADLLRESPSVFMEKYVFPNIEVRKGVFSGYFKTKDWCLLAFFINTDNNLYNFHDEDHPFDLEYQAWLSKNGIKTKTCGIDFGDNYKENSIRLHEIVDDLTGLLVIDNEAIYTGNLFEDFCFKLYEEDSDFVEKLIKELSVY